VVFEQLIAASGRGSTAVHVRAIEALGALGAKIFNRGAIDTVVSALSDRKVAVRAAAARAIRKLGQKGARNEAVNALINVLTETPTWVDWAPVQIIRAGVDVITDDVARNVFPRISAAVRLKLGLRPNLGLLPQRHYFRLQVWDKFVLVPLSGASTRRGEAAQALAVICSDVEARQTLEAFRKVLESAISNEDGWLLSTVLGAIADLGSRTIPEFTFAELIGILRKLPNIRAFSRELYYPFSTEMYYVSPWSYVIGATYRGEYEDRAESEDLPESPLIIVGRKVPAKVVAENLRTLLQEQSVRLRSNALEVLQALGGLGKIPNLLGSVSSSLQDEADGVRELAWTLIANYMKQIAVWK
jgi:HEAT repeat protein